jgi:hypothetical protein
MASADVAAVLALAPGCSIGWKPLSLPLRLEILTAEEFTTS